MRKFEAVLGLIAALLVGSQLVRHVYVRWIEPRGSVLDQFKDETEQSIPTAQSLEELLTPYEVAWKKMKEHQKKREEDRKNNENEQLDKYDGYTLKEPYKSERTLRGAIDTWEDHARQIKELHFFWWCGCAFSLVGAVSYGRIQPWAGLSLATLGFIEMLYATCPTFRILSAYAEFDRLLTWKIIYTVISVVLLLGAWLYVARTRAKTDAP